MVGRISRTPATMLSGLPVGRGVDADEHGRTRRSCVTDELLFWAPSSIVATSRRRTSAAVRRLDHHLAEVVEVGEAGVGDDVDDGEVALGLARAPTGSCSSRIAACTSAAEMPRAASRSGSSQTRMAKGWPPRISA